MFHALNLMPEYAARYVMERYFWPDAIYDREVLAPGRVLLERAPNAALRAMALASLAASARAFDWALTCSLAARAYAIADSLELHAAPDDSVLSAYLKGTWNVIDFMEAELNEELTVHLAHVSRAYEMYAAAGAAEPPAELLADPDRLWAALRGFMPEAMLATDVCRDPAGADAVTNRFRTDPGLRPRACWLDPGNEPCGPPIAQSHQSRRGPLVWLSSAVPDDVSPPDSPEAVLHAYVLAHGRRDPDLVAATLADDFVASESDSTPPSTREEELRFIEDLFAGVERVELDIRHWRARPSAFPEYPAADGYRQITTRACRYRIVRGEGTGPVRVNADGRTFVFRDDGAPEAPRWVIVAIR